MVKKTDNSSSSSPVTSGADQSIMFSLTESLKEQLGIKSKLLEIDRTALNLSKKLNETAQSQNKGLENRDKLEKQISKNQKLQERAAKLAKSYTEDLFGTHKTNYDRALDLHKLNNNDLATIQKMQDEAQETGEIDKKTLTHLYDQVEKRRKQLDIMAPSIAKSAQIALLTELQAEQLAKETAEREKELALLIEIEKNMGLLGKATKALGTLPVVGKAFTDSFAAAETRMKAIAEETGKVPSGIEAAKIQFQELSSIASGALFAAVVSQSLELNKNLNNIQRSTGMTETQAHGLNYALQGASVASGNMHMTSNDMLTTFSAVSKQIGMSAEVLGTEAIVEATALKDQMGLSAEASGQFAAQAKISGKSVKGAGEEVFGTVNQFNKLNNTAISASEVLEGVGDVSKDIGAQFGFNTEKLAGAVVEAKNLGLEIEDLNTIAGKLVNFQSSIESELEAELLTGQQLNLEKARQLALTNDLAGLGKELESQGITAEKYSKMNRIQQEATANALGMSSDQMGKMLYQQELRALGDDKFLAKYGEQNFEATKQVNTTERLQKSLAKIADVIAPFVEIFATLASNSLIVYSVVGLMLFSKLKAIGGFFTGIKDNLKSSIGFARGLVSSIRGKGDIGKTIKKKLSDKQIAAGFGGKKAKDNLLASQRKGPPPVTTTAAPKPSLGQKLGSTGKGAGKGLESLAKGLTAMGTGKVLFGALNLIPTAAGLAVMVAGIPAMIAIGAFGIKAGTGLLPLGIGLAAMGTGKVLFGAFNLIPTAVGLAVMVAGIPAMIAIGAFGARAGTGLFALGTGLAALGTGPAFAGTGVLAAAAVGFTLMTAGAVGLAAIALGGVGAAAGLEALTVGLVAMGTAAATGIPFLGVALIAALGLSLIPLTYAISLLAPLIVGVLGAVPDIINAVADGFVKMFSAISNNIGSFLLLGPALLGIAAGLAAIAFTSFGALPVILALTALGAVSGGLTAVGGMFGGKNDKEASTEEAPGEMVEVIALLKELITAVKTEGKVILDGQAVGKALALSSYKT